MFCRLITRAALAVFLLAVRAGSEPGATGKPAETPPAWKLRLTLKAGECALALSADGKALVTCGDAIKLWDTTSGKELATFSAPRTFSCFLGFAADGKALVAREDAPHPLAVALSDKPELTILDLATGKPEGTLKFPEPFAFLLLSPNGKTFATQSATRQIKIWDRKANLLSALLSPEGLMHVVYSPDGRSLAAGTAVTNVTGEIKVWDVGSGDVLMAVRDTAAVNTLAFSPDGKTLATAGTHTNSVSLWDVASGKHKGELKPTPRGQFFAVLFSPDGKTLAANWRALGSGHTPAGITLWSLPANKEPVVLKGHTEIVTALAFSADSRTLASADSTGTVLVWELVVTSPPASR
jgi:WD40 repeat protein